MPIEFRCQQCDYLLRTGDEAAGKKARCPQCGNIQVVPGESAASSAVPPRLARAEQESPFAAPSANPFADNPASATPFAPGDSPFATNFRESPPPEISRGRVKAPAIALIIASILSGLMTVGILAAGISEVQNGADEGDIAGFVMMGAMAALVNLVMLVGAIRMVSCRGYVLSMISVILALLPCNCLWILTLPFGVWGLVVLLDNNVRQQFR